VDRIAVIDMGSNSWRLVVFGYELGTSWWSLTDEIREAVRVAAGMGEERTLKPEPLDRAIHTAAVFASFCEASGIEAVEPVATSAIREAENRDELLDAIRDRTGLEVRVLGKEEEARLGYIAIANSTTLDDGFGIDLGGGSVEVVRLEGRELAEADSLPLGSVRVSEKYLPDEKASGKAQKALRAHATEVLEELGWWGDEGRLVGIGGTIRNLAAAAGKRMDLPDLDVQGFRLTRDALGDLIEELASKPASKRGGVPGIKPDRGDVILGGALVLDAAMEVGGFDELEVSEAGLREGIFFERLLDDKPEPLFDDVRTESVRNLAHRFRGDEEHVEHVAKLSLAMFDMAGEADLHPYGREERELLWAACMLHDIGTAIDYDDHHHHSHYLILNAGLPGFTPRELVLVGLIARYHRKGDPDASELGDLARGDDEERLALLCGLIRLAEQLERSRDQAIASVEVTLEGDEVAIETSANGTGADTSVAIWSARRSADLLAEAVRRPVEVREPD